MLVSCACWWPRCTGLDQLSTVGGDVLTLTGTKFGSLCGFNTLTVGTQPLAMFLCNETVIQASIPAGAGVLGRVALSVGVIPAIIGDGAAGVFSYAAPRIVALNGDSALPTLGMFTDSATPRPSVITLEGSNFGPAGYPLVVTFVSPLDGVVRPATNCTRDPVGHAWVSCYGVVGVGWLHRWAVSVAGQASPLSAQTTSFLPPQLVGVLGPGGHNANTDGGQVVRITGSEFGPAGAINDHLITVVYGPPADPARYLAEGCTVSAAGVAGSSLTCITVPGTGGNLFWTVTIANQTAATPAGPTAYGWPVIASFEGPAASAGVTEGHETVMIFGSNFGPEGTPVQAVYTATEGVRSIVVDATGSSGAVDAALAPAQFVASACEVVDAHRQINCTTAPGAGANIAWRLTIDGLTSQSPVTSYRCVSAVVGVCCACGFRAPPRACG